MTNKEANPCSIVYLWKIEDLIKTDGEPRHRQFEYHLEMEDLEPNDYEIGEDLEELLQPVMNRETIRIHIWYPGTKKVKWVTMKF